MGLPVVAIVGRPNVGKSSLLNCLAGRRISIVDPTAGVTRDRVSTPVEIRGGWLELLDTGGIGIVDADNLSDQISQQIEVGIASADLILFIVDVRDGITTLDKLVAEKLRRQGTPVILVANKADTPEGNPNAGELERLGFGPAMEVSALHRLGVPELIDTILEKVASSREGPTPPAMKIALVGKRNVGKSSFTNALAGGQRVIVSETPGTTRDSVDVTFEMGGVMMIAIDTAGIRKRSKQVSDVEWYSEHRALRSIRRADVVLFLIDSTASIGTVDKHLAAYISEEFKPVVVVINKWDLAKANSDQDDYGDYITRELPEIAYAPIVFSSALDGTGVTQSIQIAQELYRQSQIRISTAELNKVMGEMIAHATPHTPTGKPGRLYYASQVATNPPTITCFVNEISAFETNFQRFLLNQIHEKLPYSEIPIRLIFRARSRTERPPRAPDRD